MLLTSSLLYDLASPLGKVVWSRAISLRLVVTAENGSFCKNLKETPPGGLEPPTFRLTAERASQLRHGGFGVLIKFLNFLNFNFSIRAQHSDIKFSVEMVRNPPAFCEKKSGKFLSLPYRQLFNEKSTLGKFLPLLWSSTMAFRSGFRQLFHKKVLLANSCSSYKTLLIAFWSTVQCAEAKRGKFLKAPLAFSAKYLSKVFSMAESHSTFGSLNFFHCLNHIQSCNNFVPVHVKIFSLAHNT